MKVNQLAKKRAIQDIHLILIKYKGTKAKFRSSKSLIQNRVIKHDLPFSQNNLWLILSSASRSNKWGCVGLTTTEINCHHFWEKHVVKRQTHARERISRLLGPLTQPDNTEAKPKTGVGVTTNALLWKLINGIKSYQGATRNCTDL